MEIVDKGRLRELILQLEMQLLMGQTIEWETFKQFEGMSQREIEMLSVKEFEEVEEKRMQKNAWAVSRELVERIDGAPVLGERIKAYLSEDTTEHFFFNQKYLMQYISVSGQAAKDKIPGSAYVSKIIQFFNSHYAGINLTGYHPPPG